jgi:hypothetical protein
MRILAILIAALTALVVPSVIDRGANATAADATSFVAPYLDEQTVAVAHVNLAALDADAAVERFAKVAGIDPKQLAGPGREFREGVAAFQKAGATDLYAILSMADIPQPGIFVIVPRGGANDSELKAALGKLGTQVVELLDGVMFAGGKPTLDRLRNLKPARRPNLETAISAVSGSALQIVLTPSDDQRRVVSELMPMLPKEVGGGPGSILTKGIRWAAVGAEIQPKFAVKIVVQSDDAAAATALAGTINHGLDTITRDQAARRMFPKLDQMADAVRPKTADSRVTIAVDESASSLASALATGIERARESSRRQVSMNNLKQLALAWHIYLDSHKSTCPGNIMSEDGKPLLSWRVAILPYVGQEALHKQFKLDEPWDSEHNRKLIAKMPATYHAPAQKVEDGKTCYLAPTGMADKAHIGVLGIKFPKEVPDGTSNTIMIVESNDAAAVVWTKPDDLTVDPKDPIKGLLGHYEQGFAAAFADVSVRFISRVDPKNLIGLFTRDGNENVDR